MRSGSGAFEEAGIVTTGNGELHLSDMVSPPPRSPSPRAPCRSAATSRPGGAGSSPGRTWRNLGLTPQFDVNGPLAASMWKANTGQTVDGVLAIDVEGLQELLEVTGPVTTASGQVVSASNVDQILLHDQYVGETYTSDVGPARIDELSALASATLHALEDRPFKLHTMADALSSAAQGRHVLLWSADPHDRGRLARCRGGRRAPAVLADGRHHQPGREQAGPVPLARTSRSEARRPSGSQTDGDPDHDVHQPDAAGTVAVHRRPVPGPRHDQYGEYVGIATVNLPGYARDITTPSNSSVVTSGPEGPTLLEGANLDILQGATQSITFNFVLPEAHGSMTVVPSARIGPATWHVVGSDGAVDLPGRQAPDHLLVARPGPGQVPGPAAGSRVPVPGAGPVGVSRSRRRRRPGCSGTTPR